MWWIPPPRSVYRYVSNNKYKLVRSFQLDNAQQITAFSAVNNFHSCTFVSSLTLYCTDDVSGFYRATPCLRAVYAMALCLSVSVSVTSRVYNTHTRTHARTHTHTHV